MTRHWWAWIFFWAKKKDMCENTQDFLFTEHRVVLGGFVQWLFFASPWAWNVAVLIIAASAGGRILWQSQYPWWSRAQCVVILLWPASAKQIDVWYCYWIWYCRRNSPLNIEKILYLIEWSGRLMYNGNDSHDGHHGNCRACKRPTDLVCPNWVNVVLVSQWLRWDDAEHDNRLE